MNVGKLEADQLQTVTFLVVDEIKFLRHIVSEFGLVEVNSTLNISLLLQHVHT